MNGAQRWLRFGGLSLQPSEVAKLTLPLFLARLVVLRGDRIRGWIRGTVPVLLPVVLIVPLVLKQPDLGTAAFLLGGSGVLLFVGGWPIRNFVILPLLAVPAASTVFALKAYQWQRLRGFLATWTDIERAPYQIKQSLVSLGSGGLWGIGPGRGWQKLSFLPEANTDFVFAVVGEELGLAGTLTLVGVWLALFATGLKLLAGVPARSFHFIAGFTLLIQIIMQAAFNMAVVIALVPPKGIPHPLVSYGGSNLVITLVGLGVVLSLTRPGTETEFTGG